MKHTGGPHRAASTPVPWGPGVWAPSHNDSLCLLSALKEASGAAETGAPSSGQWQLLWLLRACVAWLLGTALCLWVFGNALQSKAFINAAPPHQKWSFVIIKSKNSDETFMPINSAFEIGIRVFYLIRYSPPRFISKVILKCISSLNIYLMMQCKSSQNKYEC